MWRSWQRCYASMARSKTPFEILSLPRDASPIAIKKRYYELAKQLHPDTSTGDIERFQQVARAYEFLSDPARRADYLQSGMGWGASASIVHNSRPTAYYSAYWEEPEAYRHSHSSQGHQRKYMHNAAFASLLSGVLVLVAIAEFGYFQSSRASLMDSIDRHHRRSSHDLARARIEAQTFGNQNAIGRMIEHRMRPWRQDKDK